MKEWSKEVFAKNLRMYMEKHGKTQKELAAIAGVSAPTMHDWLKGKIFPRIDKIEKLADYFGILKSDLIEENHRNYNLQLFASNDRSMIIGDVIRSLRMNRHISLMECSEELGISIEEYKQYENGSRQPTASAVNAIAHLFGIQSVDITDSFLLSDHEINGHAITMEHIEKAIKWNEAFDYVVLTDEEVEKMAQYARYLLWQRGNN